MKLITLNTWGGQANLNDLIAFFASHNDTDIFCLQEVFHNASQLVKLSASGRALQNIEPNLLTIITTTLPEYQVLFNPQFRDVYGLVTLVHKKHTIISQGEVYVYKQKGFESKKDIGNHARHLQHVTIKYKKGTLTTINLHALWNGKGKTDSKDRILQSKNIIDFTTTLKNPFILAGDFNLRPDTKSIKLLEDGGLKNLITQYNITDTRTSLYTKSERFADYVFISKDINVKK